MASNSRRAVLTGIGLISPIGLDPASFWDSLKNGRSGIRTIQSFDVSGLPVRIGGEIPDFDAKSFVDKKERKSLRVMARAIQLAVAAAQVALNDSNLDKSKLDPTRFGVEFGAGLIPTELDEMASAAQSSLNSHPDAIDLKKWGDVGLPAMPPLWMLKYLPNMLGCHISILHNAQGPNNTITASDAASLLALGEAYRILGRNQADIFLVGGGDSKMHPLALVRHFLFECLSKRNDAPDRACRPFDRRRDGMVMGEGAGVFVLEELEHARRRGARIYGELVGFGAAFDSKRSGAGLARAIRTALQEAGIGPDQIDHVNAHGYGTPGEDAWEARGIHEVFGACKPSVPVFAGKSYFGNLCAGSGAVEFAASLLAFQHGFVPPTLNYEEPDPDCPVDVISGKPREVQRPYFLKIGFTERGQCAAVVVRRS